MCFLLRQTLCLSLPTKRHIQARIFKLNCLLNCQVFFTSPWTAIPSCSPSCLCTTPPFFKYWRCIMRLPFSQGQRGRVEMRIPAQAAVKAAAHDGNTRLHERKRTEANKLSSASSDCVVLYVTHRDHIKISRALRVLLNLVMAWQDAVKSVRHSVKVYILKWILSTEK